MKSITEISETLSLINSREKADTVQWTGHYRASGNLTGFPDPVENDLDFAFDISVGFFSQFFSCCVALSKSSHCYSFSFPQLSVCISGD